MASAFRRDVALSSSRLHAFLRDAHLDVVHLAVTLRRSEADQMLAVPLVGNVLDRYTSAGTYYYNVVFWLDHALFAPAFLRGRTRAELAAFATEERPPALPSAFSRATRRWAAEYARSRSSA